MEGTEVMQRSIPTPILKMKLILVILCVIFVSTIANQGRLERKSLSDIVAASTSVKSGKVQISPKPVTNNGKAALKSTSALSDNDLKGYMCILGGFLTHMTLGTLYCWGNLGSYAPHSLKFFDGKEHIGKTPDSSLVLPLTLFAQCLSLPFGSIITGKIGSQKTMILGSSILALGVYLSSYAKTLLQFISFYSIMVGAGIGMAYTAPMIAGWKYLPNLKGFVSGAILTGFGAGGFLYNFLGTSLANPDGLNPIKGKFPNIVYDRFPSVLRKLAVIYFLVALAGASLVKEPPKIDTTKSVKTPVAVVSGVSVNEALHTVQFWQIWIMIIGAASCGLNVASVYKQFASNAPALAGDGFQSLVGGMGALFNGVGRIFWGSLSDKIGFKKSYIVLTSAQVVLHSLYSYSAVNKNLFLLATCLSFFLLAGNFALIPPATQRLFGAKNGPLIYGLVYSAFGVASVGGNYLSKFLNGKYGSDKVFMIMGLMSMVSTILTIVLKPLKSLASSQL